MCQTFSPEFISQGSSLQPSFGTRARGVCVSSMSSGAFLRIPRAPRLQRTLNPPDGTPCHLIPPLVDSATTRVFSASESSFLCGNCSGVWGFINHISPCHFSSELLSSLPRGERSSGLMLRALSVRFCELILSTRSGTCSGLCLL